MAPATRATSNATDVVSNADTGTSPSTTPRKVPHCTKCKRPRVGHPRSGCPYAEAESGSAAPSPNHSPHRSASAQATPDNSTPATPHRTGRRSIGSNNIVTAMSTMHISGSSPSRETEEQIKAVIRDRTRRKSEQFANALQPRGLTGAASLASLSTTSDEIVEMLMQPGILDGDDTEPECEGNSPLKGKTSRIIQWQETIRVDTTSLKPALRKPKSSPQSPMPGTLITPNPSFFESQSTVEDLRVKQEEGHGPRVLVTSPTPSFTPRKSGPRPLVRSMSSEQRQYFLSQLGRNSKAQVHVLAKDTVYEIAEEARDMGFAAEVALNGDEDSDEAFLVVGKNRLEVEKLARRVAFVGQEVTASNASTTGTNATPAAVSSGSSNLRAVAGGAVVGAVGAWAGLAFS